MRKKSPCVYQMVIVNFVAIKTKRLRVRKAGLFFGLFCKTLGRNSRNFAQKLKELKFSRKKMHILLVKHFLVFFQLNLYLKTVSTSWLNLEKHKLPISDLKIQILVGKRILRKGTVEQQLFKELVKTQVSFTNSKKISSKTQKNFVKNSIFRKLRNFL